ncbi:hypothetical protein K439DRAFT_1393877 [Ramaria rubella]|nr:hypothetical protein K439DRAFT_1393877 [Ramaria rubella]
MTSTAIEQAHYTSSDEEGGIHRTKRRKGPKACDVCRRKKIRCDQDPSGDAHKPCLNCSVFKTDCTYTYVAKKRRTQQAYIDSLQNRLSKLERVLCTIAPDIDLSTDVEDILASLAPRLRPRSRSPLRPVPRPSPHPNIKPSEVVAAFTEWRDPPEGEDESEDERVVFLPGPSGREHKFHGNSSGIGLLKKVIGMKRESTEGEFEDRLKNEKLFGAYPTPWEARVSHSPPPIFTFPPASLLTHLTDLFFRNVNPYIPLLHRPSFEAALREGKHEHDTELGSVVLLMCATASRWSNDERVLPVGMEGAGLGENDGAGAGTGAVEEPTWTSAGWDFYAQVHHRYRRNLIHSTSVYELQRLALGSLYLQGTASSSAAWQFAGLGIRLALEAGIHRRKRPGKECVLENEMWKRAFWTLVVLDRTGSASLGRPCAIWEEDIDLDLPLEVDDEYLTPEAGFTQPPSKPSYIAYFNSSVKLSQILIGALRTIYPISKSKSIFRLVGPTWEQDMVAALDSSLNNWVENIPEHLRWNPTLTTDDLTFTQSALLHSTYNYVQIIVHRPYITPSRSRARESPSSPLAKLAFPSLAICTNAARSCSHILDACLRRNELMLWPQLNYCAFTSAIVLLFNVWGMNTHGPGGRVRVDCVKQMQDVHICMRYIKRSRARWYSATKLGNVLRDLVFVGDLPLPGQSPPSHSNAGQGQKRTREMEDSTPDGDVGADTTPSPTNGVDHGSIGTFGGASNTSDFFFQPNTDKTTQLQHSNHNSNSNANSVHSGSLLPNSLEPSPHSPSHREIKQEPFISEEQQERHSQYWGSLGLNPAYPSLDLGQGSSEPQQSFRTHEQVNLDLLEQFTYRFGADSVFPALAVDGAGNVVQGLGQSQGAHSSAAQGQGRLEDALDSDVLSALDSVYLTDGSAALGSNVDMDVAQHTFDVWGSAPTGFQWDEWQQFTNVVQNVPPEVPVGTNQPEDPGDPPLQWGTY